MIEMSTDVADADARLVLVSPTVKTPAAPLMPTSLSSSPRPLGSITLDTSKSPARWRVVCEPHVMVRLKRLFARVNKGSHGSVLIAHNPETCRDLLWFCERFPMAFGTPGDRHKMVQGAEAHKDRERLVAEVLSGDYRPAPCPLAIPLREYQQIAVDLILRSGSLLLADEVGIGKTAVAIGVISDPRCRPALVVTLTHLPRQWKREINRFAPELDVFIPKTRKAAELTKARKGKGQTMFPETPDVIILNYHKLDGWADELSGLVRSIVLDEVQELRSGPGSLKYQGASHIAEKCVVRVGLSATPVYNFGGEIYNVLNVLSPDALGTREEFNREWCNYSSDRPRLADPQAFGMYVRDAGLMLRRTRADVGRELPALSTIVHEIDADLSEIESIADSAAELARVILAQGDVKLEKGAKFRASEELSWKLRQATGIAKAKFVAEFVRLLVENGEAVLLGGWHHEVYALWRDWLDDLKPAFFTGAETGNEKAESFRRFDSGETKVLIMSLRAGAGLDGLQRSCKTVVFGELDWSPAAHHQFIGRVHRDGQDSPVMAYYLVADAGSDPVVSDILGLKTQQIEGIIAPDAPRVEVIGGHEVTEGHIKRLAEQFLRQRGLRLTEETSNV